MSTSSYLMRRTRARQETELLFAARDVLESYDGGYLDIVPRIAGDDAVTAIAIERLRAAIDSSART